MLGRFWGGPFVRPLWPSMRSPVLLRVETTQGTPSTATNVWYHKPRKVLVAATLLSQDKQLAGILPDGRDLPLLVPMTAVSSTRRCLWANTAVGRAHTYARVASVSSCCVCTVSGQHRGGAAVAYPSGYRRKLDLLARMEPSTRGLRQRRQSEWANRPVRSRFPKAVQCRGNRQSGPLAGHPGSGPPARCLRKMDCCAGAAILMSLCPLL